MATTFDDSLMNEIRSRNNIVQVVGDYVSLKKAGGSYKGLCPFHGEKTPSFTVNESRQFFYCSASDGTNVVASGERFCTHELTEFCGSRRGCSAARSFFPMIPSPACRRT